MGEEGGGGFINRMHVAFLLEGEGRCDRPGGRGEKGDRAARGATPPHSTALHDTVVGVVAGGGSGRRPERSSTVAAAVVGYVSAGDAFVVCPSPA